MNLTKVATVSAYVVAGFFSIDALLVGKGLLPAIGVAFFLFFLVKGVILTPSYFMKGLRGTPDSPVIQSVPLNAKLVKRDDE
jgi:hypothetical protein